ncbi:MAG: hypothetical protein N3D84_02165 [Candidatus Woesearchaeota archaeon]|nr:hypothetical protein [Candidatus Woesearchaeota archaeon]
MKTFAKAVDSMDIDELIKLKNDIDNGCQQIKEMIMKKIAHEIRKNTCCICESRINPYSPFNFSLSFGPKDIKRKAKFCGIDCLLYFINNLREMANLDHKENYREKIRDEISYKEDQNKNEDQKTSSKKQ